MTPGGTRNGSDIDPATQLYRLGAGGPSLTAGMAAAGATGRRIALLHIDIDRLSAINQAWGDAVGDEVLVAVAQRLRKAMPRGSFLWRLGSDEFIAGVAYRRKEPDGVVIAERLREAFDAPLPVPPHNVRVTLSIGIAVYPDDAQDAASLLACAEKAVHRAKRDAGRGGTGFSAMPDPAGAALDEPLPRSILKGIDEEEFELFHQPTVDAQDGSIDSVSVLLRWRNAQYGLLRPSHFLDLVERSGLTARLGYWVVDRAMRQLAQWREMGLDYFDMSVHLADPMLLRGDCVDLVGEALHRYGIQGARMQFEISESALARDTRAVHDTLAGLRRLGALLTVHDFGMGGLALGTLAQYPLDRLKIDRSFIHEAASDPRTAAIVRGIIAMGHGLGMKVAAKGVETEAEFNFLRRNQCDFFLGHLFCPPLAAGQALDVLRRRALLPEGFAAERPELTLLLVDDEDNVLRSLVRLFRRDGYRLLTASSVRDAFDLLASNRVQVIVSDQRMPEMSGTEFLGRVRDLYPDTIRMVLSGYTDLATITDAINRGAIYRFLTKPWNDEEFREHIRDAFRASEQQAAADERT